MNRTEWNAWHDDLAKRLPVLGAYIADLDTNIRDLWFADIFSQHELRDAQQMTYRLWESGESLESYARDKLPSVFIRMLSEIKYDREKRAERDRASRRTSTQGALASVKSDPVMGKAYRELLSRQAAYRATHGVDRTPDDVRKQWVDELLG